MTIAFTVTVGESDWREDLSGWNCSALAIPGAVIEGVYTQDTKVDDACFQALKGYNTIRWVHGTPPPKRATIAIKLGKELSTQELTLRWRKLAIILPVMATVILGIAARIVPLTGPATGAPLWTIKGTVLNTNEFNATEVDTFIMPPDLRLRPDFTFSGEMPIQTRSDGSLVLPTVIFAIKSRPGFDSPVVHLANPGEKLPPGAMDYALEVIPQSKTIQIRKPIEIRRPSELVSTQQPELEQTRSATASFVPDH